MAEEVSIDVSADVLKEALEDTGDYKVFDDNTDGVEEAISWILDTDFTEQTGAQFILDRLRPDEVIPYAWETYLNKTAAYLADNNHNAINLICDTLIQTIIMRKGVDYVLDQVGLDNRINRVCTTDVPYIVAALEERRSMYIADDELCAIRNLMSRITASKEKMEILGKYLESNCSEENIDAMLGPIYSDKIIRHCESSIEGMVIRLKETPTEEMIEVLLSYFDEFDFRTELLKQMRRHGIMLETILRAYIEDERNEEARAHDY